MKKLLLLIITSFMLAAPHAHASHIRGGLITYTFLDDSLTYKIYQVKLVIYQDAANGPVATTEDNPAFLAVYDAGATHHLINADSVFYSSADTIVTSLSSVCVGSLPNILILKKTFLKRYALPTNTSGYIVDYQRCCHAGTITNIHDPADNGITYFCTIPAAPGFNSSAVFTADPPFVVRLNTPLSYNLSATDPDGDSLSYGFTAAFYGTNDANIKPFPPGPPPFDTALYMPGFSADNPVSSSPAVHPLQQPVSSQVYPIILAAS